MLNLEDVSKNMDALISEYSLCVSNNRYLFDGDLEELFSDSDIKLGEVSNKAKDYKCDANGWLVDCEDGDYLETVELTQNGKTYLCQAFSDKHGDGLDYALDLNNLCVLS